MASSSIANSSSGNARSTGVCGQPYKYCRVSTPLYAQVLMPDGLITASGAVEVANRQTSKKAAFTWCSRLRAPNARTDTPRIGTASGNSSVQARVDNRCSSTPGCGQHRRADRLASLHDQTEVAPRARILSRCCAYTIGGLRGSAIGSPRAVTSPHAQPSNGARPPNNGSPAHIFRQRPQATLVAAGCFAASRRCPSPVPVELPSFLTHNNRETVPVYPGACRFCRQC